MSRKSTAADEPQYYNFLFIDPQKFENNSDLSEAWKSFLSAIFFVGKSKITINMHESHLDKTGKLWNCSGPIDEETLDEKSWKILGIWREEKKVIVLIVLREKDEKIAKKRKRAMNEALKSTKPNDYDHEFIAKNYSEGKEEGINLLLRAFHECLPSELKPEFLKNNVSKENDERNAEPKQECDILRVGSPQEDAKPRYESVDVKIFVETIIATRNDDQEPETNSETVTNEPTSTQENYIQEEDPLAIENAELENTTIPVTPTTNDQDLQNHQILETNSETVTNEQISAQENDIQEEDLSKFENTALENTSTTVTPTTNHRDLQNYQVFETNPETATNEQTSTQENDIQEEDPSKFDTAELENTTIPVTPTTNDQDLQNYQVLETNPEAATNEQTYPQENDIQEEDLSKFENTALENTSTSVTPTTNHRDSLNESSPDSGIDLTDSAERNSNNNRFRRGNSPIYKLRSRIRRELFPSPSSSNPFSDYSLKDINEFGRNIEDYEKLEWTAFEAFQPESSRPCTGRENTGPFRFFNYLLIDPEKYEESCETSTEWKSFWSAIFYVGKGSNDRPYDHMNEAIRIHEEQNRNRKTPSKLMQQIWSIWEAKRGVIILWLFLDKLKEESLTREALMIDAIKFHYRHLCNVKCGTYYGVVSTWMNKEKLELGMYLIYEAFRKFCHKDEYQQEVFPPDSYFNKEVDYNEC